MHFMSRHLTGVNTLDNNRSTAYSSDLTTDKFWLFPAIVKNSELTRKRLTAILIIIIIWIILEPANEYISQLFCSMQVLLSRIVISKWWSSKVADKTLLFCLLHGCTCFIHGWKWVKYYKFKKKPFYLFSYLLLLSHMKNTAVNFMITLSEGPQQPNVCK